MDKKMTLDDLFDLVAAGLAKRFDLETRKGRAACRSAIEAAHYHGRSIDPSFDGWLRTIRNSPGSGDDCGVQRLIDLTMTVQRSAATVADIGGAS